MHEHNCDNSNNINEITSIRITKNNNDTDANIE